MLWGEMADITQITEPNSINFSADSTTADLWMREHYGAHNIFFDLPSDSADALAFIEAAKTQGFSIGAQSPSVLIGIGVQRFSQSADGNA
jgi:hypothetical protein